MGNQQSAAHALPRARKNVHWKSAGRPAVPGKPEIIPMLSDEEPNAITLRWAPSAHDGGSPLHGYQVECNRLGSEEWVRTAPAVVARPELLLSGLAAPHRYRFRVAALAAAGRSDYSPLSDVLTVAAEDSAGAAAPAFTRRPADLTVLENEPSEFRVAFTGRPVPAIAWFKDDYEIFSSRRTAITTDDGSSVLVFHQTQAGDEGEIRCTATNRAGHCAARARLSLLAAPRLRCPRHYEDGLLVETSETICLKVGLVGRPAPAVEWSHDGRPLAPGARVEISTTPAYSMLKIRAARREDRGEYQVAARNEVGADAAAVLVTVTAPPEPPRQVRVARQLDRGVALAWQPPPDDGGCQVGTYVVEYWRAGWNVWLKATTSRAPSATLYDLIEGSEYRFRVKAESPYGMSPPSEESAPVTIPGRPPDPAALAAEAAILAAREDPVEPPPPPTPRRARPAPPAPAVPAPAADDDEFMLLLCPADAPRPAANQPTERGESFQLELSEALCPPALSLSAPELSPRVLGPPGGLRRAVSCSRLLLERAMARAYTALALQDEQRRAPSPVPPARPAFLAVAAPAWPHASFDDDYTASTVTSADEFSDSGSGSGREAPADYQPTYHPPSSASPHSPVSSSPPTTPPPPAMSLPDPTFVPKPILKKREPNPPVAAPMDNHFAKPRSPTPDRIGSKREEKKKGTLFKKITKMPIQKPNFAFSRLGTKKSAEQKTQNKEIPEAVKPTPQFDKSEATYDDPGRTVIEHYGNIVKEYGSQKRPTTPLYLNTEDLKTVAEKQESEDKASAQSKINKKRKAVASRPQDNSATATKPNVKAQVSKKPAKATKAKPNPAKKETAPASKPEENHEASRKKCSQQVVLTTTERATIVIPIDYGQLERKAKAQVRAALECCVDACLLLLALWLLVWRDERLALAPLLLVAHRRLRAPRLPPRLAALLRLPAASAGDTRSDTQPR